MQFYELLQSSNSAEAHLVQIIIHFAVDDEAELKKHMKSICDPLFDKFVAIFEDLEGDLKRVKKTKAAFKKDFNLIVEDTFLYMFHNATKVKGGCIFVETSLDSSYGDEHVDEIFYIENAIQYKEFRRFDPIYSFLYKTGRGDFIYIIKALEEALKGHPIVTILDRYNRNKNYEIERPKLVFEDNEKRRSSDDDEDDD